MHAFVSRLRTIRAGGATQNRDSLVTLSNLARSSNLNAWQGVGRTSCGRPSPLTKPSWACQHRKVSASMPTILQARRSRAPASVTVVMPNFKSSEARCVLFECGSRGNALSRGPLPSFSAAQNVGTRPLPCTVSLCYSHAANELIRLSARLSLDFGLPVDSCVASSDNGFGTPANMRVVAFICHCPARRDGHLLLFTCVCP